MDDLRRTVGRTQAIAGCLWCDFKVRRVWAEQARSRARKHARETGHEAYARYEQTDFYKPQDGA